MISKPKDVLLGFEIPCKTWLPMKEVMRRIIVKPGLCPHVVAYSLVHSLENVNVPFGGKANFADFSSSENPIVGPGRLNGKVMETPNYGGQSPMNRLPEGWVSEDDSVSDIRPMQVSPWRTCWYHPINR